MATATYTKSGTKSTTPAKLDAKVFGVEVKDHNLIKQAYTTYLANGRENFAKTLKRGEVSGGGKKPWRQKGTGRARFGSSRNPIWRGGGIAFGPTGNENYSKKLNTQSKKLAIKQALSLTSGKVIVIESFDIKSAKTKDALSLLEKIGAKGNILLVISSKSPEVVRATNNLENVKTVSANYLNVYDLMNADCIVISQDSLAVISQWLGESK